METTSVVPTGTARAADGPSPVWPLCALAIGLVGFALIFLPESTAAIHVWSVSTAYSHCFFVLPIALYLAWDRRQEIRATPVVLTPAAAILAVPMAVGWMMAERLGIMEGRQLIALGMLQILFLTILGPRMWRSLSAPLLYLFFLVPFGAFITPALQGFTAHFIVAGLDLFGIPNFADAYQIEIPEGNFYVAEACAGLRFLIASVAFGVLYSLVIYRSYARRAAFMAVSIVVPVVANGVRALGIVVLGHLIGNAEAAAADHLIYGWVFFSAVMLLLVAGGLPFRQDQPTGAPPVADHAGARRPAFARVLGQVSWPASGRALGQAHRSFLPWGIAATCIVLICAAGPCMALLLDHVSSAPVAHVRLSFVTPPGCEPLGGATASHVAGSVADLAEFTCGRETIRATAVTFSPRANPAQLARAQRDLTGEDQAEDAAIHALEINTMVPAQWREAETGEPARVTASAYWIDGAPAPPGLRGRAMQALNSVVGSRFKPVLIAVSLDRPETRLNSEGREQATSKIVAFLASQTTLAAQIEKLSHRPPS